jgi:hypothetical protein
VISRYAERGSRLDHPHDDPEDTRDVGASIDKVTEEDDLASIRMLGSACIVAQPLEQRLEFGSASMDVANDVEGSMIASPIIPERLAFDGRLLNLLRGRQYEDVSETLWLQGAERATQLLGLLPDDMRTEIAVRPFFVAFLANPLGQVEHDRDRQAVILARKGHEGLPRLGLHIGCIDNSELTRRKTLRTDEVQQFERIVGRGLAVFVVANQPTAEVG